MSTDYYFEKWRITLAKLENLTVLDEEYQVTKAQDKKWCEAVQRLTGVLGSYIFIYKETMNCFDHNLQVQKTDVMKGIIHAIVARILELKHQIQKLTASDYQFLGHGLVNYKLTTNDVELSEIPPKLNAPEDIKKMVLEAIEKAELRKEKKSINDIKEHNENITEKVNWWDNNDNMDNNSEKSHKGINVTAIYELKKKKEVTVEMLESTKMVTLIQAHERSRKLILLLTQQKQSREKWEKELNGTLLPPARHEMRERSAKLIQRICRAFLKAKRTQIEEQKRDEILNIRLGEKNNQNSKIHGELDEYTKKFQDYKKKWQEDCDKIKINYMKRKQRDIEDDVRDEIMNWFLKWFDEASFFHQIPKANEGGSILIVKEEVPSPEEWIQNYKAYLEEKKANKNKTAYELKWEKCEAKKELLAEKRADHLKKKKEEQVLRKMMKNPNYHPGYQYPESKHIKHLWKAIEEYRRNWSNLDLWKTPGVKEKSVIDVDISDVLMNAKMEIRKSVDDVMRETLKTLQKALKLDYQRNGEVMPEQIKERTRRKKKMQKHEIIVSDDIALKMEELAFRGMLKGYPSLNIEDFIGDPNFAGDDLRCMLKPVQAFAGETRALWWERCREVSHRHQRILLVGPKGSGKTTLVSCLASMNDAVLFEVDPAWIPEELLSAVYLQQLAASIAACAKTTQPSVIHIRHIHRLYYTKVPPNEDAENLNLIKQYLVRKLLKKINKTDKVTVIASCIDPWLVKSKLIVKQFPNIILLPETNYSAVTTILRNWVLDNHFVPKSLNIQSLAYVLQGYPFAHIKDTLDKFSTADRIIKIAAYGLTVDEIYNYFLELNEEKVDYKRYLKWYTDKTHWGKKEKKQLEEQREFQRLSEEMQEKKKKKKKTYIDSMSDVSTDKGK